MKAYICAGALLAALATPAFSGPANATDKKPTTTKLLNQQQMKLLNQQKLEMQAALNAGALAGGGSGTGTGGSTGDISSGNSDVSAWGFSYARPPVTIPQASIGDGVAVTSLGFEVGPLFSWGNSSAEYLPRALTDLAAVVYHATTNDGTPNGAANQRAYLVALCAKAPDVAAQIPVGCE